MPGYYKVVLVQSFFEQTLINILYYGDLGGAPFAGYSLAQAAEIGVEAGDLWGSALAATWPTTWTLETAKVSFVDAHGETDPATSEIDVAIGIPGTAIASTDGAYQAGVIALKGTLAPGAAALVKRSYVAVGPVPSLGIDDDGALKDAPLTALQNLANGLIVPLVTGSFGNAYPVRVGRTLPAEPARVTAVNFSIVRPNATVRKSRKRRAAG